jgi:hypothetical protein
MAMVCFAALSNNHLEQLLVFDDGTARILSLREDKLWECTPGAAKVNVVGKPALYGV